VGVYYTREAYESPRGDGVRISVDRHLHYGVLEAPGSLSCAQWWPVRVPGTILEVKFTGSFPAWVANLVHRGEITRRGVCKYLMCSQQAGRPVHQVFA
jgi:hypothetical protein